uniref:Uncharacterized protein n=1 Tax=viral metagenome TaxID=1070528 RepID=A0A6C0HEJ5_9ZZZZ
MSTTSGEQKHICFYSNKCRWSEAFIKAISQTPYKHEFHFICVDVKPNGSRVKLPGWLKKVPTLVIKGEDEPRTDGSVMNWLSERNVLRKPENAQKQSEPEPWISGEMGGSYTKSFSFLGSKDTNEAPEGDFSFLNGQSAVSTKTASDMPGGGLGARGQQKSKKEDLFDKQMQNYMTQRSQGMPPPVMRS